MPKPKFNKRTLQSLEQLAGLRQQLADQEFEALRAAQEAAAIRQQTAGEIAARESNILNNAKGVRQASTGRMHFTRGKKGSGIYIPVTSSGKIEVPMSSEKPLLTAKEIQMPAPPITGRIRIKSSTNPFVNVTQSMQNAYDMGLPGLQSMFQSDMSFMHAPLMDRLIDRTGRSYHSIARTINPETGLIRTNYFDVKDPTQLYWNKLHEMAGTKRITAKQSEELLQSRPMQNIFAKMQDLLGIDRKVTTRINPQTIIKTGNTVGAMDTTPQIKAMAAQRQQNALRALQQLESENGVVTKIGTNGKPFKIMPMGFSYPSSIITTESLPLNFYNDVHVDDLGEYFIVDGKKFHFKQGGIVSAKSGIHIKKANRGKFTDYCGGKVTSECIARGKASSNPTIRKRATFAANARKWKHKNGGIVPFWAHDILGGE